MLTAQDEAEIAGYPQDVQEIIRETDRMYSARDEMWRLYTHSIRHEGGYVSHHGVFDDGKECTFGDSPTDYHFGLSYASWLVLPRLSLREMPLDWQVKFFRLLEEAEERYGMQTPDGLIIQRKGPDQKWVSNAHWNNYRHGNVRAAMSIDIEKGLRDPRIEPSSPREEHIR